LVTAVSACEEEIADGTALSQDEVRTALVSLIDRGLVDRMAETPTRFVAASPSVVESMSRKDWRSCAPRSRRPMGSWR
jgi:sugar-specific transcriptional regulator TrmB